MANDRTQLQAILQGVSQRLQTGQINKKDLEESKIVNSILLSDLCEQVEALNKKLDNTIEANNTDGE